MVHNRLLLSRVYLAGAMDRVPDGGVQWRENITPWLNSRGIVVFNPIDKPCEIGRENAETRRIRHASKMKGDYGPLLADRVVRSVDLRLVDISDFIICNLNLETHPCGTYEETFLANREKKPVIWRIEQGKNHAPDWLWWTFPHEMIFSTWNEVKAYIDHIAFSENVDRMKRWVFFDLDKVTEPALEGWKRFYKDWTQPAVDDIKNWLPSEEQAREVFTEE